MKKRILTLLLSSTLICSSMPAQAAFGLGNLMSWALNQAQPGINSAVDQKDQEFTEGLSGIGTFGRLIGCVAVFFMLESLMKNLTQDQTRAGQRGIGILDLLFGGINAATGFNPFPQKTQRGTNFLVNHGWLGNAAPVDTALQNAKTGYQNVKTGYQNVRTGIDTMVNGLQGQPPVNNNNLQGQQQPAAQQAPQQQAAAPQQQSPTIWDTMGNAWNRVCNATNALFA